MTLVDSLDTLWLMGMMDEFEAAKVGPRQSPAHAMACSVTWSVRLQTFPVSPPCLSPAGVGTAAP